jgi:hypothetical protein
MALLREESRLDDEKLTEQLVWFEQRAQELLSSELTAILCEIEAHFFRQEIPFDGWPYLSESGEGVKALETVEFAPFKRFLREIDRAWKYFEPLEESLPRDDELGLRRAEFYRGCRSWLSFLKLDPQLNPDDLQVKIEGGDPVTRPYGKEVPQDTAQFRYKTVTLDLGLCFEQESGPGRDCARPLRIATLFEEKIRRREAIWSWTARTDLTELSVGLVDGWEAEGSRQRYANVRRVLGKSSALALCAYLHRHGVRHEDRWVTSHAFDLAVELKKKGQGDLAAALGAQERIVGEKFFFTLRRPLPDPIRRLSEAAAPAAPVRTKEADDDW